MEEEQTYVGTEFADKVEQGITDTIQKGVNWYQQASKDQEGYLDEALRLTAGGIKNVGNWWADSTRDQEGIGDDILRGIGSIAGAGMRVLDAGSYYGGKLGGGIATLLGVDPRIGGALGNVAGDVLAGGAIAKGLKVSRAARALQRVSPLEGRALLTGQQWGLAPGAPGALHTPQGFFNDFVKAARLPGSTQTELIEAGNRLAPQFKGERKVYNLVKRGDKQKAVNAIAQDLVNDPELAWSIFSGETKRSVLGEVYNAQGQRMRLQGIESFFNAKDKKTALKKLDLVNAETSNAANLDRAIRMRPPEDGSVTRVFQEVLADTPELVPEFEKAYRKQQMVGFNRTKQAAAERGWTLKQIDEYRRTGKRPHKTELVGEQFDAGHWRATMSEPHHLVMDKPGWSKDLKKTEIWHAPTSDRAARIESRIANQLAKSDIKHDINPFAAKRVGIPRTWEEDITMWIHRELNTGKYPDWYELGAGYADWAEDIPWDMPEKEVEKLWRAFDERIKADPNHVNNWRHKELYKEIREAINNAKKAPQDFITSEKEAAKLIKNKDPDIEAMRRTLASIGREGAIRN